MHVSFLLHIIHASNFLSLSKQKTMKPFSILLLTFLIATISSSSSYATRSEPSAAVYSVEAKSKLEKSNQNSKGTGGGNGGGGGGGFFGPGSGFNIPGFGSGWGNGGSGGYGAGYGGPSGGYSKGGIVRSAFECKDKGPCYKKKLTCPAKCFYSYSRSGKNYGSGGGGGGCTIDCKKTCTAYC